MVGHLILKDWRLQQPDDHPIHRGRRNCADDPAIGRRDASSSSGSVFFFISLIFCGSLLPVSNIVNERKKQTLAFLMSLPISSVQYANRETCVDRRDVSGALADAGRRRVWLITVRHVLPNGVIPMALILALLPFVGFCIITGAALIS